MRKVEVGVVRASGERGACERWGDDGAAARSEVTGHRSVAMADTGGRLDSGGCQKAGKRPAVELGSVALVYCNVRRAQEVDDALD